MEQPELVMKFLTVLGAPRNHKTFQERVGCQVDLRVDVL